MAKLRGQITMSIDGFVAGPDPDEENPLGVGGERLHEWALELAAFQEAHGRSGGAVNASTPVMEGMFENVGAVVMGRNMFGPMRGGEWGDDPWTGWWGEDPPYHMPTFILTHYARESVEMKGGTTFHFVTDGPEVALQRAFDAAGGKDVLASGGANCLQQYMKAGLLEELTISLVPLLMGAGTRLFEDLDGASIKLEQAEVIPAPGVTHLIYELRN